MRKYDVFISYRRDGGTETAKHIRDSLVEKGYRVFFDLESLRAGPFNTKLLEVIEKADDFVLILPPGGLERCAYEGDWVRLEIEHAIAMKKNIIPVMLNGFEFPEVLPQSIECIRFMNGVNANVEFYDAFIEKLTGFLTSTKRIRGKKSLLIVVALAAVLCIGAFFAARSLAPKEISPFGKVTGDTYINDILNVEAVWDKNSWTIMNRQQMNEILGMTKEIMSMSEEEQLATEGGYLDFVVISNDGTANLNIYISTMDAYDTAYLQTDHDAALDLAIEEMITNLEFTYDAMGYTDMNSSIGTYQYNNKTYSTVCASVKALGTTMYQQVLSLGVKDYLFTITATTFERDFTDIVLDRLLKN